MALHMPTAVARQFNFVFIMRIPYKLWRQQGVMCCALARLRPLEGITHVFQEQQKYLCQNLRILSINVALRWAGQWLRRKVCTSGDLMR
jgi:hypothetical protein